MLKQIDDAVLVSKYLSGDEIALSDLISKHQQKIYGFIFSKVQDSNLTEDIFQDTFIKVIKNLKKGKYNEEGKFLPWVFRIAYNLVIDHFRRVKKQNTIKNSDKFDLFNLIADPNFNIENELISEQINFDLTKLIEELPDDQKEVLKLRYYNAFFQLLETNLSI